MKFFLTVFVLHICLFAAPATFEYQFVNFGVNEGLPSAQIYEIVQDPKGYIWFGTDRGLVRYNGYEFKVYTINEGLSTNVIFKLDIDDKGRICCYGKDCKIYILEQERFIEFKYNQEFIALHSARSNLLDFDFNASGLSYSTSDGIDGRTAMGKFNIDGTYQLETNSGISIKTENRALIGVLNSQKVDSIYLNGDFIGLTHPSKYGSKNAPFANVGQKDGVVYFSVAENLYQYKPGGGDQFEKLHAFSDEILDMKFDNYGNLFVGVRNGGLWRIETKKLFQPTCILPNETVSNILIDDQDGIWVGTLFSGLFYCKNQEIRKLGLGNDEVVTFMMTLGDDVYGVTGSDKIIRFDCTDTAVSESIYYSPLTMTEYIVYLQTSREFSSELFHIGVLLDHQTKRYISLQFNARDFFLGDSLFYVVSRTGVSVYRENLKHDEQILYEYNKLLNCGMSYQDSLFLIGTDEGIMLHDLDDESFVKKYKPWIEYKVDEMNDYRPEHPFFRAKMRDMININDSTMIFGSAEQGLIIERLGFPDIWLHQRDGLISDAIDRLYVQNDKLVVISKEGISVLSQEDGIVNYTVKNGLLSNNVTDVIIREGQLWVATDQGISVFDLDTHHESSLPIYLTSLKINGESKAIQTRYELDYKTSLIDISFEGLSYPQEGAIIYKYKLKGVDKTWIETPNTTVRYANLPYGKFEFLIMAQKSDQTWTDEVMLFKIHRIKPFWETKFFAILIIILAIGLFLFGFSLRLKRLKRLEKDKFLMLNMERKTLQAQMHPHFVFNSLTSLQSLIIDDKKLESQEFLAKFAKLTRLALNHSTKNTISLKEEIDVLTLYIDLERIRYSNKFEYQITCDLNEFDVEIPPMLIQPFIENAIKHGLANRADKGLLTISFQLRDATTFLCQVTDNGVGRSAVKNNKNEKSLGIKLVSQRLNIILKQRKEDSVRIEDLYENDQPCGTRVSIILPLKITQL